tara:strand:+ start:194 stop:400 length:207 start_codon:yes stop_codon:yes gene_type:complete
VERQHRHQHNKLIYMLTDHKQIAFQKHQKKQFYPPPEPCNKDNETACNNVSNMFIFATWQIMKKYLRK